MSQKLAIRVVRRADREITEAAAWWRANRPKAPDAFHEELQRAFDLIASQPQVGARAHNVKLAGVRRVHLSRIRYYLLSEYHHEGHCRGVSLVAYKSWSWAGAIDRNHIASLGIT